MSIHHECQCDECKKFHHHHDKCNCQKNNHHNNQCNCRKNDHRHNQCNCQKNDHQHNQCNCQNNLNHRFHHEKHHDRFENRLFCEDRFVVRLGGLRNGMAFRLRQLLDCDIKIIVADENEKIHGKLVFVGTDFVEVLVNNDRVEMTRKGKQRKQECTGKMQSRIVPFESIKFIENLD